MIQQELARSVIQPPSLGDRGLREGSRKLRTARDYHERGEVEVRGRRPRRDDEFFAPMRMGKDDWET